MDADIAASARTMLRLSGISKLYAGSVALHSTDLSITRGETTVLIGPSGCGKSTMLRIILGLVSPSTGTVYFDGESVSDDNVRSIRLRTGYVIQKGGLFPHMTAGANVTLMARYLGWNPDQINERLEELTDLVHLPVACLERYPLRLSGGESQRVSIMRALFLNPEVLLMDEPLGALDPMIRFDLQQELRLIFRKLRKTVIMVTHDMAEAAFFGHSIVLMRYGHIAQHGTMADLVQRPSSDFVQNFMQAQRGLHALDSE